MKNWKLIGAGAGIAAAAVLSFALYGRRDTTVSADNAGTIAPQNQSFLSKLSRQPERVTMPADTKLPIRLEHAISTEKNSSGDSFTGLLDGPLMVDGKLVAPTHSKVIGQLTQVKESGRVEGRASLTMVLQKLIVDGKEYDLDTVPITRVARSTKKKDAAIIGGGAAARLPAAARARPSAPEWAAAQAPVTCSPPRAIRSPMGGRLASSLSSRSPSNCRFTNRPVEPAWGWSDRRSPPGRPCCFNTRLTLRRAI